MRGKGSPDFASVGKYDQFQKGREGRWCTSQNPARSSPQYKRVGKGCIGRKTLAWWQGYPCARNHLQDTCGFMAEMAKAVLGGQMATDRYLGAYVCGPKPSVWRFICQKFPSYSAIHMSEVPVLLVRPVRPPGRPQRSSHFPLQETPPGLAFRQVPGPRGRHPGRPRLQAPRKASATSKDQGGARTKNTRIKLRAYPCRRPRGRAP